LSVSLCVFVVRSTIFTEESESIQYQNVIDQYGC
jgi:hypothetical protein